MAVLTLLLPPRARLAAEPALAPGPLASWWHRGDRADAAAPGREAALRSVFQFTGKTLPVAALTRQLDAGDAAGAVWLRADPAYARADMTTARLLACGELGLSAAEAQALIQPLRPLFGDAGFPIDAPVPQRWYLRCPPGAQLPAFSAPADVLGDDLGRHLPTAAQGRRWRSLFNEAQILLHQHPLNAERVRRGQLPVNALWFWGGGTLPEWVRGAVTVVLGEDVPLRALAARAGVRAHAAEPAALAGLAADAAALLDLAVERDGGVLRTWIEAVAAALRDGRLSALDVRFESGERLHVTARQRWRFWRRLRPLPA